MLNIFIVVAYRNIITCGVRRSRGEMYIDHGRVWCVCVSVCPRRIPILLHGLGLRASGNLPVSYVLTGNLPVTYHQ